MELRVTQGTLAEDIGTAREVVSRILKQFQSRDILKTGRGKILLLDLEALKQMSSTLCD